MDEGRGRNRGLVPRLAAHAAAAAAYSSFGPMPPVTTALIVANTLVHLRPGPLYHLLPPIHDVYFNPHLIFKNRDLKRFFLSPFYHTGETHLYCNMLSLLGNGTRFEPSMGSIEFASMVAALLGMSQGIALLMAKMLLLFYEDAPYYREYSAGFTGVLFAMEVVLRSQSTEYTSVRGLIVPLRNAKLVEMIFMFASELPYLGQLGGILAGLLYLKLRRIFRGSDPFASLVRGFIDIVKWPVKFLQSLFFGLRSCVFGRGSVTTPGIWRCRTCTHVNDTMEDVCEMCHTERDAGNQMTGGHNPHSDLTLEEQRQRLLERLNLMSDQLQNSLVRLDPTLHELLRGRFGR